jgi:hypothetical protein
MNAFKIKVKWEKIAAKFKQKPLSSEDEDSLFYNANEEELWEKRDKKLAKTKEELHKMITKS